MTSVTKTFVGASGTAIDSYDANFGYTLSGPVLELDGSGNLRMRTGTGFDYGFVRYAGTFSNDQESEVVFGTLAASGCTVLLGVRCSSSDSGYELFIRAASDITLYSPGEASTLGNVTYTPVTGDKVTLRARDTTLTVLINDVVQFTATDATRASGNPGIGMVQNTFLNPPYTLVDTWSGRDYTTGTVYNLAANQGSYNLAGAPDSIDAAVGANQGSFTLSGKTITAKVQRTLAAAKGQFTLTGFATRVRSLTAAIGSFVTTGNNAAFTVQRGVTIPPAVYDLGLELFEVRQGTVVLFWRAPVAGPSIFFTVYANNVPLPVQTATTLTISGLLPDTNYDIHVEANTTPSVVSRTISYSYASRNQTTVTEMERVKASPPIGFGPM